MALTAGTRLGPYEIVSALGAGGMGEVYRARDTRLERTVAIKILPESLAADPQFRERFDREARAISQLDHPHICALYDVGDDHGTAFLVMQYLEGETLADRLVKGRMPFDQALRIAIEIAGALDKAHRAGIVHRDLKPGNIMLTKAGAKLLDFGLAKTGAPVAAGAGASMLPTTPAGLTVQGTILGTFQYMAPEQLEGQEADARSDIFAFGAVLYEMLTGNKAFEGKSHASLIGAILKDDPRPITEVQPLAPLALAHVVNTCLSKDPDERWQTAADIAHQLKWIVKTGSQPPAAARVTLVPRSAIRRAVPFVATALIATVVSLAAAWRLMRPDEATSPLITRFVIASPSGVAPRGAGAGRHLVALSPQGTHLVYWADNQLYLRAMDQLGEAKPIPGTEGAREPFFSADGQWIGFHQGQLKKVSIRGGAVMRLGEAGNPYGASWEADDQVLFGLGPDGIWKVAGTGGTPEKVIGVNDGEEAHGPQQLPDGSILYTLRPKGTNSWDDAQIVIESRAAGRTVLIRGGRDARYLPAGYLVYGVTGVLYAVPFDVSTHTLRGNAVPVAEGVMDADIRTGAMHYSVSADGSLVYVIGASGERGTLLFMDRQGRPMPLPAEPMEYARPRISPDGMKVALEVGADDNRSVQIYDLARFTLTRLTSDPLRAARFPLWTRDSQRVVFYSDFEGGGLFSKAADGTGTATRLTTSAVEQQPYAWSADGRTLVVEQATTGTANTTGLYVVPLDGTGNATPLLKASTGDSQPALSPDGRWIAYTEQMQGVYVRPFPDVENGRWLIAAAGRSAVWSRDGRELFIIARGQAMAVSIETQPAFRAGNPRVMFELGPYYRGGEGLGTRQWDIDPVNGRFLLLNPGDPGTTAEKATQPQIVVVRNWLEELKRAVPAN